MNHAVGQMRRYRRLPSILDQVCSLACRSSLETGLLISTRNPWRISRTNFDERKTLRVTVGFSGLFEPANFLSGETTDGTRLE